MTPISSRLALSIVPCYIWNVRRDTTRYYHCSPTPGLRGLKPGTPQYFGKPYLVYMTTSLPMALFYGIQNFEYTYGYRKTGQLYFAEYFPDTLQTLYAGKSASLYLYAPENATSTFHHVPSAYWSGDRFLPLP